MNESSHDNHPEELLDLHVLHALDPGEEAQLQAHLERCALCRQSLALKLRIGAMLGEMVEQQPPPAGLQGRVMRAVAEASRQPGVKGASAQPGHSPGRWTRLALPLAASLVVVALGVSLLVVQQLTAGRLENLELQNRALAERLSQVLAAAAQERETVGHLRAANYMIADPTTRRMPLEPVNNGNAPYHGVLLVSEDGRHAVLMVAGMAAPASSQEYQEGYQVWLLRQDKRVAIGTVTVDTTGWGTASLAPQESVFGFDWVALAMNPGTAAPPSAETMLLRTRITAGGTAR